MPPRWQYRLLQTGMLPLRPDGHLDVTAEHRCTAVLLWPEEQKPSADNLVVTDPCFTRTGWGEAERVLAELGLRGDDLRVVFQTHAHHDHAPVRPFGVRAPLDQLLVVSEPRFAGLETVSLPGHSPDLHALTFCDAEGRAVWVVGDAIIDLEWLLSWGYYWPNRYSPLEVAVTWRSVGRCLASANVVVPGHGGEIAVTGDLLRGLLADYPLAESSEGAPDVPGLLRGRLLAL